MVTESTKQLFDGITEDDVDKVRGALARSDVDINHQQTGTGSTALHLCLGKIEIVNELILHKPNIGIFNKEGHTPLHVAAKFGYAEALFLLLQHGADINAKRDEDSPTPLDVALQDDFIPTTVYYLLFCGAALTSSAREKLDMETLENHETILQGFETKKISFQGLTVNPGTEVHLDRLEIDVTNLSNTHIDFFCRKIEAPYQDSEKFTPKIPLSIENKKHRPKKKNLNAVDSDVLISDIFQIKLGAGGRFNLTLPIYKKPSDQDLKYSELIIQTSHKTPENDLLLLEIKGAICTEGKVTVRNIDLGLEGQSPLVAVAVFLRTKIDQETVNAKQSAVIASKAESNFRVSTTERTFAEQTDVALQVRKPNDAVDNRTTAEEELLGKSDVYSALSAEPPAEDVIAIELPKPRSLAVATKHYNTIVMTCEQAKDGDRADSWRSVEDKVAETADGVKVEAGFGHFIVLAVKSLKSVGRRLKKIASQLYMSAVGNKEWCSLLAMTQRLNESATQRFTIMCLLCRYDQTDVLIHKYRREKYDIQSCGKSKYINVDTKKTYVLTFELYNAKLLTRVQQLPIQYQAQHDNFQTVHVEVTGRTASPYGNVFLLKKRLPEKKIKELEFGEHIAVLVPVMFEVGNLSEIPGEFLDDRLLQKVATKLGDDWFEVLVRLGMPVMELKGLDMTNHKETNFLKLKQWREKNSHRADRGLCMLLCSLTSAARVDIRKMIEKYLNDYVQKLYTSPEGYDEVDSGPSFKEWLNNYKVDRRGEMIEINIDQLMKDNASMSPFDDRFLYYVSSFIVNEDIIVKNMGLKDSKYNDMKCISPPSRRMCQMLAVLKASHSEDPPCNFVRQLIGAIKDTRNELAVLEIKEKIKEWLESKDPNFSASEMNKIKQRLKIH